MTETTTAGTKAKTTKHATSSFDMPDYGIPKFEMAKFDLPNMEMPEAFREIGEKGVAHARDAYAKAKVASEEAADLFENTYATVAKGVPQTTISSLSRLPVPTRAPPLTTSMSCWV